MGDLLIILVTSALENVHVNLMCLEANVMKALKVTLDFLENLKNVTAMRMDLSVLHAMKLLENVLVMNISLETNVTNLLKNILAFPHPNLVNVMLMAQKVRIVMRMENALVKHMSL